MDTEAGMLSGISRKCSLRSRICWFTEFCNSQCLSQFAAPFIVVRAETSIAESCKIRHTHSETRKAPLRENEKPKEHRHKACEFGSVEMEVVATRAARRWPQGHIKPRCYPLPPLDLSRTRAERIRILSPCPEAHNNDSQWCKFGYACE